LKDIIIALALIFVSLSGVVCLLGLFLMIKGVYGLRREGIQRIWHKEGRIIISIAVLFMDAANIIIVVLLTHPLSVNIGMYILVVVLYVFAFVFTTYGFILSLKSRRKKAATNL
jgi:hypothetical protein